VLARARAIRGRNLACEDASVGHSRGRSVTPSSSHRTSRTWGRYCSLSNGTGYSPNDVQSILSRHRSFIVGLAGGLLLVAASQPAAAYKCDGPAGVLLLPSRSVEQQVDAAVARNVRHRLASVPFGPSPTVISANELEDFIGGDATRQQFDGQLDEVELQARARRGLLEPPVEAKIPFGFAGLAWAIRHPSEAWRLILPVLVS